MSKKEQKKTVDHSSEDSVGSVADGNELQVQIDELMAQNVQLVAQVEQLNDAMLRERADADNVRRRAEDEKVKLGSFYKALVVKQLLPVIDNFERAHAAAQRSSDQEAVSKEVAELQKGFESMFKQFGDVLQKLDVHRVNALGQPFDPHTMEAVSAEEGDGDQEVVSEELQSGYRLGDDLLRPAMVRVKS